MAPEEPLKDILREGVELLVSEAVPVKDADMVCVGVFVLLWVSGAEPVPDTEAV